MVFSVRPEELGLELDERGLLPIEAARARVRAAKAFERGEQHAVAGQRFMPTDADRLWLALLSLETAEEFVSEASRIEWKFPTRGGDNIDPVLRFGAGVLPWLSAMLAADGTLPSFLPMIERSLVAIGPEAVHVIVRAKKPFDADADKLGLVDEWLKRHGDIAWAALAAAAREEGDARRTIVALAKRSPTTVKRKLVAALGKADATAMLVSVGKLEATTILRMLDAAASSPIDERLPWPGLRATAGHFEFHAIRVIGVRAATGDDWGILIEVVQGDLLDRGVRWPAVVQQYTYGSRVPIGGRYLEDARPLTVDARAIDATEAARLDLRPGRSTTGAVESWPDVLRIRAALATARETIFPDPSELVRALKIKKPQILVVSETFAHVDGPELGQDALAALPSTSIAYRSLAEAIAHRDPARFEPGVANTDWRDHAAREQSFSWT